MRRVSVTTLEKFRRYMAETSPRDTEQALIESMSGQFLGNDKTKFGSAYHKILEGDYVAHENEIAVVGDDREVFVFTKEQYQPALDFREQHIYMVHEIDQRKNYITSYGEIQVTGRVDGLQAMKARDGKTRFRNLDESEYRDSCQWKFYLDMLDIDEFYYDVFEVKGFTELKGSPHRFPGVTIVKHDPIPCMRYHGMEEELNTLLNDFLAYVENRRIHHLLKPAFSNENSFLF